MVLEEDGRPKSPWHCNGRIWPIPMSGVVSPTTRVRCERSFFTRQLLRNSHSLISDCVQRVGVGTSLLVHEARASSDDVDIVKSCRPRTQPPYKPWIVSQLPPTHLRWIALL